MTLSFSTEIGTVSRTEVQPEDLRDAIATLSFENKLVRPVPAPGLGPHVLLDWAKAELDEALAADGDSDPARRKAFTATVIAKTAVECLLDWYLDSSHISFVLRPHAGTEEKLEALDAEGLLAIGTSLFRDVLFAPRNKAIHDYHAVDLKSAKHAYELARLFVRNSQPTHSPGVRNVYYGPLDAARGDEARRREGLPPRKQKKTTKKTEVQFEYKNFYFGGIGSVHECGVFFCRNGRCLAVLEAGKDHAIDVRHASLSAFSAPLLREIITTLEKTKPAVHDLEDHEVDHVVHTLNEVVTGKSRFAK